MVKGCGRKGINVGEQSRIGRCRVGATGDTGINVLDSPIVKSCIVIGATNYGIKGGFGCQILQSISNYNAGAGIYAANSSIIRDCTASFSSSGDGLFAYAATNCYGVSTNGIGLHAFTATNCFGTSAGSTAGSAFGIWADVAFGCWGQTTATSGGVALRFVKMAAMCYAQRDNPFASFSVLGTGAAGQQDRP